MLNKKPHGFTIVELLIVIVVIAILATISVVAYNGVQNRANDTTVQSDLSNFAKKIQLVAAETGEFPAGGGARSASGAAATGDAGIFPGMSFQFTRGSYTEASQNISYCTGPSAGGSGTIFRIVARSKSGKFFDYSSSQGLKEAGAVTIHETTGNSCDGIGYPRTWSYGRSASTWRPWTD